MQNFGGGILKIQVTISHIEYYIFNLPPPEFFRAKKIVKYNFPDPFPPHLLQVTIFLPPPPKTKVKGVEIVFETARRPHFVQEIYRGIPL